MGLTTFTVDVGCIVQFNRCLRMRWMHLMLLTT